MEIKNKYDFTLSGSVARTDLLLTNVQCGFTLAEILITLGIIGVVAAMTIPVLLTNYKANRLRTQFLKTYSVVQQVFKQMEADDVSTNPSDYVRVKGGAIFIEFLKTTLLVLQIVGMFYLRAYHQLLV